MSGASAAALTAAAVFMAPAATAAPSDQVDDAARAVQEQAQQAVEEAEQALEEARQQAEEAAENSSNRAQQEAEEAVDEAEQALQDAQQEAEEAANTVQQESQDVFGSMQQVDMGDWMPDDLRQDLRELQDLPASERAQRLQEIVQDSLSGEYGDEAETWTERVGGTIASLPQDLRQDIQSIFGQEPEEARADVRQIVEGAVDGEYGEDVEQWADWLRNTSQRWDLARALQGSPLDTSGTPMDMSGTPMDMSGDMMDEMQGSIMERIPDDVLQQIPNDVLQQMRSQLQGN